MIFILLSCQSESISEPTTQSPTFLRDAVLLSGEGDFWTRFKDIDWHKQESIELNGQNYSTPKRASCLSVFQVPLGDASRLAAVGVEANTDVVFSPDEKMLAVGTQLGDVFVLDAYTGTVISKSHFSEGMIKFVRWSSDGKALYAAEQSPDAYVYALNPQDLSIQWKLRLADRVKSSPLPAGEDVYGIYSLPAAYGLDVLKNGQILIAAAHSWGPYGSERQNLSQLLLVSQDGEVVGQWPEEPADVIMKHPRIDAENKMAALILSRSANNEQTSTIPSHGVQVLSLPTLEPMTHIESEPLAPYFSTADIWEGFSIKNDVLMGLLDGRVVRVDNKGNIKWTIEPSTPMMAGDVPIHASIGWGDWVGESALFTTSVTYIPFGADVPNQQPPMAHPQANRVVYVDEKGGEQWSWQGAPIIQGLSIRSDETEVLVGGGRRQGDERLDAFGGYLLDIGEDPMLSADRLRAHCATEAPVFFRHALSSDGRVALIEIPFKKQDGEILGSYQLSVMR